MALAGVLIAVRVRHPKGATSPLNASAREVAPKPAGSSPSSLAASKGEVPSPPPSPADRGSNPAKAAPSAEEARELGKAEGVPPTNSSSAGATPSARATPPASKAEADDRTKLLAWLGEKRKEALANLERAKEEAAGDATSSREQASVLRARLSQRPVTLTLKDGSVLRDAVVRSFTMQEAEVGAEGGVRTVGWDSLDPASCRAAADALFGREVAKDQFDRGRFFVARRRWKEALEAFEKAEALGEVLDNEPRAALARLAAGAGGFRGSPRRAGPETLLLTYDWRDAKQLEDWSEGLRLEGGLAFLASETRQEILLRGVVEPGAPEAPVTFVDEINLEVTLSSTGPVSFTLFRNPQRGYEVELGPERVRLVRVYPSEPEDRGRREIVSSDKANIVFGKTHHLRLRAKKWMFTLWVDQQEAVTLEEELPSATAKPAQGHFGLSVTNGRLNLESPLVLQGRVSKEELDARMGESEVIIRRAIEPELEMIRQWRIEETAREMIEGVKPLPLVSDQAPGFLTRLSYNDQSKYWKLNREYVSYTKGLVDREFSLEDWKKRVSAMITAYPRFPSLYYLRAICHHEQQSHGLAKEDLKKALELFPEFPEALVYRAELLLEEYDLEESLAAVDRAIELKPDLAEAYVVRARIRFATSLGGREALLEDLSLTRKLDPLDRAAVYYQRVLTRELRGPRDLGCRFDCETKHYHVTTDISKEAARKYGDALEAAWQQYERTFKSVPRRPLLQKPRVAIFQTAENYYTYFELISESRGEHTLGVYRDSLNELVLFETLDRDETLHTLFHEAFHHFMSLMAPSTPPYWYNEGMAEYMGAIAVEHGKVTKDAKILDGRLFGARIMIELDAALPFEKIMCETPREFYAPTGFDKYAQAWSMIHFFYAKHRDRIERYFALLREGRTPREAYVAAFKDKVGELEKEWREYVRKLKP